MVRRGATRLGKRAAWRSRKTRNRKKKGRLAFYKPLLSNKLPIKHRYFYSDQLNPGVGGINAVNVFSANSLHDPDVTGSGAQPRGFDQIKELYDHYTVVGAKITVVFMSQSGTTVPIICGIALADSATTHTATVDYMEQRNVVSGGLGETDARTTLVKTFSARKFLGRPHPLSEDDLRGTALTSPNERAYFHVFASPTYSVDAGAISYYAIIDYLAVWTEPKNPDQS